MDTPDTWNPLQYGHVGELGTQPFFDLVALVKPKPNMRVIDLGCGTGELTAWLHRRLEASETLGMDRSTSELKKSQEFVEPGLSFVRGDIQAFPSELGLGWDLILSSTALHWLRDHPRLIARFYEALAPGGQLALQIPSNHAHPTYAVAQQIAQEAPFRAALSEDGPPESPVLKPEEYAGILFRLGSPAPHVREQVYVHALRDRSEVLEGVRGTVLTEYEHRLGPVLFEVFLQRYRARLEAVLADTRPFFFPFKRILLWARKADGSA